MNNIVRQVKKMGSNLTVAANELRDYRLEKDNHNPDDRFNLNLKLPDSSQELTSASRTSHKMILEISGEKPLRNIREPELKDGVVRTFLSLEDSRQTDDEIAMSQYYELELEGDPNEGDWQIELNTKSKEQEDPERDHRYVFLKA